MAFEILLEFMHMGFSQQKPCTPTFETKNWERYINKTFLKFELLIFFPSFSTSRFELLIEYAPRSRYITFYAKL